MSIDSILKEVMQLRASDLYLLPYQSKYQLKCHSQGRSHLLRQLSLEEAHQFIATIKYRSEMNISESRRPQLGRFTFENIWIRVSTVGDFLDRETLVLRFIYDQQGGLNWLLSDQFETLKVGLPDAGLFVIAGPTGSGKTTTLYELLRQFQKERLILTIEDPVEIYEPNFVQLQVNEAAGIGYQELIKVALRHRPEILLVGEIRDQATAKAALQAALSGHLVLSTIHALSAQDVRLRLLELGVDAGQLDVALQGTIYQRLLPAVDQKIAALAEFWFKQDQQLSNTWEEGLYAALQAKKITSATYQQFKKVQTT
ncbi:competence type IV pilus ATPase ComGA [Convivina intestini]|uniref:Competence protein ComGA n=1 Tax=Convivina intestini TaxID=1505726 RepID=A0A2U1D5V3_9LACO|nr:competence type IV pilus ATPase ComGA [Convivina intestini]PVY83063.1 competence protein ComGA [Convivina intestini]CAH1856494.1 ComG operon protein 1 [Convivina intestini]SDB98816.1 competence protein ComGA [Leuconostocaceae bacterium R-53105]